MVKRKVKIARIITRLNVGGPAIHTVLLTQALCDEEFESFLVTGQVGKNERDMFYLAEEKGIKPLVVPELVREIHPIIDFIGLCKLYSLLKKENPDIVHTHTSKAGALGRMAAVFAGIPVRIHTFHGDLFKGYFNKFLVRIFIVIERILANFSKFIIVISEREREEIAVRYKIAPQSKIKVIPLGLELDNFFSVTTRRNKIRNEFMISEDVIVVGIIGRLVPIKNHKMFLEVAKRLNELMAERSKVKYLIVGDGEERTSLEKYAKNLKIDSDVYFSGWRKDMADVYSDLDIIALTSINEGTPVTLIEALAASRPIVATNVGGVRDVVEDGVNGYLVDSGDLEGFSRRLAELAQDFSKRNAFGRAGREMVRKKFTINRLVHDIKLLYREALGSS